jgi:hypothetical protein
MPDTLELGGGYTIRLAALDPTTGNAVTGVTVSQLVIALAALGDTVIGSLEVGPFMLVPGPEA